MSALRAAAPRFSLARCLVLLVFALLVIAVGQRLADRSTSLVRTSAQDTVAGWGPADFPSALATLQRDVARERARVEASPGQWMPLETLAMVLHARGQLNGSHADHAAALDAVNAARAAAPAASGPVLARAVVALSLHQNTIAREEVARLAHFAIPPAPSDLAEAEAIRGDVAFYAGHYARAIRHYRAADRIERSPGTMVRLADWHRHMGDFDAARTLLGRGLADRATTTPWMRASYLLQLGAIELQSGNWAAAERLFSAADRAFPDWWLVKAHLGQMAAVRSDFATAEMLYREAMTGAERPSVMDALAALYRAMGRTADADALAVRAAALWNARVDSHPEAYADHAFEAALAAGDPVRAWRLAVLNYRARPYGDGRIGLARAALARGRAQSARAILEELERTGWRSTEQYRVLADACTQIGDRTCAARARRQALAISPQAYHPRADLLAFGHH